MDSDVGYQEAVPTLGRQEGDVADDAAVGQPDEAVGQAGRGRVYAIEKATNLRPDIVAQQLAVVKLQRFAEHQLEQFDDLPYVAGHVDRAQSLACPRF